MVTFRRSSHSLPVLTSPEVPERCDTGGRTTSAQRRPVRPRSVIFASRAPQRHQTVAGVLPPQATSEKERLSKRENARFCPVCRNRPGNVE